MSPTSYQTAPPRVKAGAGVYGSIPQGSTAHTRNAATRQGGSLQVWYRGGDSNPYSLWPLPPQGSVSTNSTTSANFRTTQSLEYLPAPEQHLALPAPAHLQPPELSVEPELPQDPAIQLDLLYQLFL